MEETIVEENVVGIIPTFAKLFPPTENLEDIYMERICYLLNTDDLLEEMLR